MKSFGSLSQPSKIVSVILSKEDFRKKLLNIGQNARHKYRGTLKPKATEHLKKEIETAMSNVTHQFGMRKKMVFNDKTNSWIADGMTSGGIYSENGESTNGIPLYSMSLNKKELDAMLLKLENGHSSKEEFLKLLTECKNFLKIKAVPLYSYLGKEWFSEPSEELIKELISEQDRKRQKMKEDIDAKKNLETKLEEYQTDKEKGKFFNVFLGKTKKDTESSQRDTDLMKKSMESGLHYTDRARNEYDGPTRSGSYSYAIEGTYYAMKSEENEKVTVWTIKKLLKLLEKDGYETVTVKRRGYLDWKIEIKDKDGEIKDISNTFGNTYLPKHLPKDNFKVITPETEVVDKKRVKGTKKPSGKKVKDNAELKSSIVKNNADSKDYEQNKKREKKEFVTDTSEDKRVDGLKSEVKGVGYEIKRNLDRNGVEIHFTGKPTQEVLEKLKGMGYKWSFNNKCWYRKDDGTSDEQIKEKISE